MTPETKPKTTSLRTQIYLKLKTLIEQDNWEIGDKLPSEKNLCEQYQVSRVTIRSAILQNLSHFFKENISFPKMAKSNFLCNLLQKNYL